MTLLSEGILMGMLILPVVLPPGGLVPDDPITHLSVSSLPVHSMLFTILSLSKEISHFLSGLSKGRGQGNIEARYNKGG